jgi:Na+-transporting methylmalonyl-CoA/oxaloacetate decarboxylase gamma subunit
MDNLAFGLQITAVGMGLVFALLGLLWGLLALAGRLEPRPAPAAPPDAPALELAAGDTALRVEGAGVEQLPPEALAAIAAAVLAHAANRRGQAAPEMRSYWPGSLLFASRWVAAGRDRQTRGYKRERS